METISTYVQLFFLIIPIILLVATYNVRKRTEAIMFQRIALISLTLLLVDDALASLFAINGKYGVFYTTLFLLSEPLEHVCTAMMFHFTVTTIGEQVKLKSTLHAIPFVLGVVGIVLWIYSYFSGFYYVVDSGGKIELTDKFFISGIFCIIPLVAEVIVIIVYRRKLGALRTALMLFYTLLPLCGYPIEYFTKLPFVNVITVASWLIIHILLTVNKQFEFSEQQRKFAEQQLMLNENQTRIMISQIQPHFLYNSLATIGYICHKDAETASHAIDQFADYLRMNLAAISSSDLIPFKQELEHVKTYLWLEKMRFEERLNVVYQIDATDFRLPCLCVQPLVENAVKHGLLEKKEGGTLTLRSMEFNTEYVIIIEDNGVGFNVSDCGSDGKLHIGIDNVRKRLEYLCGGKLEIVSSIGKGTVATIRIKKERED